MKEKWNLIKLIAIPISLLILAVLFTACAQEVPSPTAAPPTAVPPTPVPPTAVLPTAIPPTANESCLFCHGIENIAMTVGKESVPVYVDFAAYQQTKHGDVECVQCHTDINPTPPHNANRTYGSWARFSLKDTDVTLTRNFYSVSADACLVCHDDPAYAAVPQSEHGTIKDMKFLADGSPRVEVILKGTDGQEYKADENFAPADCERCHINTNCASCHWASAINQKQEGSVLDLWTMYDKESDTAKGAMTEYGMDWTINVASHEFRSAEDLTSSNDVCTACHIGYYQGDKSIPALGLEGIGIRRHPQVQELALSAQRGVHENVQLCTACHTDVHDMTLKNTEHGARLEGKAQCTNCHADKTPAGETHKTVTCIACHDAELGVHLDNGMVYPMALKHNLEESWPSHNLTKDVQCTKCHVAGNEVGAPETVPAGEIHP